MLTIKQYGLPRSGTNFMKDVLLKNWNVSVDTDISNSKHAQWFPTGMPSIAVVKNPYAWLVSVYRRFADPALEDQNPFFIEEDFPTYLCTRFVARYRQKDIIREYRSANPIQHWNDYNWHYLSVMDWSDEMLVVKYEDMLDPLNAEVALGSFMERWGAESTSDTLKLPVKEVVPGSGNDYKDRTTYGEGNFDTGYYIQAKYMKQFTPELVAFVSQELDHDLMGRLGYDLI